MLQGWRYVAWVDDGRFEDCWARLDRAVEHCNQFGDEWAAFLEQHPYDVSVRVYDDGRGTVSITRNQSIPRRLPLLIGEFLYELRAALDNCLYKVAVRHSGRNPPPGEGVLPFPIYDDPAAWARNLYRLAHLSAEHREMLERIQPYNAERQGLNCLSILTPGAPTGTARCIWSALSSSRPSLGTTQPAAGRPAQGDERVHRRPTRPHPRPHRTRRRRQYRALSSCPFGGTSAGSRRSGSAAPAAP